MYWEHLVLAALASRLPRPRQQVAIAPWWAYRHICLLLTDGHGRLGQAWFEVPMGGKVWFAVRLGLSSVYRGWSAEAVRVPDWTVKGGESDQCQLLMGPLNFKIFLGGPRTPPLFGS